MTSFWIRMLMLMMCLSAIMLHGISAAEELLKIGILASLDTPAGKGIRQGAEMAAQEINEKGGILGKPIQLVISDDKFNADIASYEYVKLVQVDKVAAIIGTSSSEIALAVMEQMGKFKTPFLATGSASPKLTRQVEQHYHLYKYFFRVCHDSDESTEITTNWLIHLAKTHNMQKAALMVESAIWTKSIAETWVKELTDAGVEISVIEYFYKETKDFTPILSKIISRQADMICVLSAHIDAGAYINPWADLKGPILTGIISSYSTLDSASDKVLSISTRFSAGITGLTSKDKRFCENYMKQYNIIPEYSSPYTYDAMYILKAAIEKAKSYEPDALTDALEKTAYDGVIGKWVFEKSHHSKYGAGYRQLMIAQWQQDGKPCIVWPENLKTCEFILPPWYKEKK